jgi:prohibitin 2
MEKEVEFNPTKWVAKVAVLVILLIAVASTVLGFVAVVPAGYKGVLLTFGKVEPRILDSGISTVTPFMNQVVPVSIQTQKYSADASSASADLQIVTTKVTLNYHLQPDKVNYIYQNIGLGFEDKVIAPAIQEAVKASTAKLTAEELITKRPVVKEAIETSLKEKLTNYDIVVESVYITDFSFSQEFENAIESKVTAQQLAQRAENDLVRIKVEAEQAISQARGAAEAKLLIATAEAKAIELQGQALKANPEIVQLRWVERWNGLLPQYLLSPTAANGVILNLPEMKGG